MSHAEHHILKCTHCDAVIMQCRCFDPHKPVRYAAGPCPSCAGGADTPPRLEPEEAIDSPPWHPVHDPVVMLRLRDIVHQPPPPRETVLVLLKEPEGNLTIEAAQHDPDTAAEEWQWINTWECTPLRGTLIGWAPYPVEPFFSARQLHGLASWLEAQTMAGSPGQTMAKELRRLLGD